MKSAGMIPVFREEFPSTFDAMAGAIDRAIAAMLKHVIIARENVPCTRLCLEEALVNAIRHGNRCELQRKVGLEIDLSEDYCTIRVRDEGAGFHPENIQLPVCDQLGGRGICLMRHYMEQVRYDKTECCLEMKFRPKAACKGE